MTKGKPRMMLLPHAVDLPVPAEHATGLDLVAAIPADCPWSSRRGSGPRSRPASSLRCRRASEGRSGRAPDLPCGMGSPCSIRRAPWMPIIAARSRLS